jgi:hypothetical protein
MLLDLAPPFCSRRMLVGSNDRRIYRMDVPIHVSLPICLLLEL